LISAVDNELLFDVDQYGEHSDGRSLELRGDEPLTLITKKQSNNATWTMVKQGTSTEECNKILDGITRVGHRRGDTLYKSPQFPDYILKRYHYFITLYILKYNHTSIIELEYPLVYTIYTKQGIAIPLSLMLLSLLN
jgi:hypothetical protein